MPNINIEVQNLDAVLDLTNLDIDGTLNKDIQELAFFNEAETTRNIRDRIYRQPPSENYRRTGRALGGRTIKRVGRGRRIVNDTRLKGASRNYAPFLNRNRRIPRFNTFYFDDAVEATREKARELLRTFTRRARR